jgi:hypothetical protein
MDYIPALKVWMWPIFDKKGVLLKIHPFRVQNTSGDSLEESLIILEK